VFGKANEQQIDQVIIKSKLSPQEQPGSCGLVHQEQLYIAWVLSLFLRSRACYPGTTWILSLLLALVTGLGYWPCY